MVRFTILVVTLVVFAGTSNAQGPGDDVKQLKKEVELLKAKLEVANLKVEKLQKENDEIKAGGATAKPVADDGFGVGTKLVGVVTRSFAGADGKRVVLGDDTEFEVTNRSGREFTAEFWTNDRKVGAKVEGTIGTNGVVKFSSTNSLGDMVVNLVGVHVFEGRLDKKGVLSGTTKKKGDQSYRGEWKLKTQKE